MGNQKKSHSPPTKLRGKPVTATQIVSWFFAAPIWIFMCIWVPIVLVFVWMALMPWRLFLSLRSRMTGKNFGS